MVYGIMNEEFYSLFKDHVDQAKSVLNRPMSVAEKILYAHLYDFSDLKNFRRGEDYINFRPDRVAMQDATAQMALLQFMNANQSLTSVPTSVHCDHLITAHLGAEKDLETAKAENSEVYDFLSAATSKYGIDFWQVGSGIIHQVVLENYSFPGCMIIGTDSHTPNAGGLTMIAIGVGGADAVDVMAGMEWELKLPKLIGVKLSGRLNAWVSPKDIILKLAGILTVKGGTNYIIEYFGDGVESISATGRSTITNMGAEVGATTSIFAFDKNTADYLIATSREGIAKLATKYSSYLQPDIEVITSPEKFFDKVIEIDLSTLEPHINGPFSPDEATPISLFATKVKEMNFPEKIEVGLIGSCTNSSYQDLSRAASIVAQVVEKGIKPQAKLIVNPGSQLVLCTAVRDNIISAFKDAGATIMANACGACIGQWKRETDDPLRRNSIVTSFNRNFAKRNDGNPNTFAFVASPEITAAMAIAGSLLFNPLTDTLPDRDGNNIKLDPPKGDIFPKNGFIVDDKGYFPPQKNKDDIDIKISPNSERLQVLEPFLPFNINDFNNLILLIKVKGKCTTDHISMAGEWLKFRGHLKNISKNMLMGATNFFNDKTDSVINHLTGNYDKVSAVADYYKSNNISSIVIAEDNYGEGSSREHAAMEPRFLNVKVIVAKSFARIHETNLKKQGMLALTFLNPSDYDKIIEDDKIFIIGLDNFQPKKEIKAKIIHNNGNEEIITLIHSYNEQQINWFKAGSALNTLKQK